MATDSAAAAPCEQDDRRRSVPLLAHAAERSSVEDQWPEESFKRTATFDMRLARDLKSLDDKEANDLKSPPEEHPTREESSYAIPEGSFAGTFHVVAFVCFSFSSP